MIQLMLAEGLWSSAGLEKLSSKEWIYGMQAFIQKAIHECVCALAYFGDFIEQSVTCEVHTGVSSESNQT